MASNAIIVIMAKHKLPVFPNRLLFVQCFQIFIVACTFDSSQDRHSGVFGKEEQMKERKKVALRNFT